LARGLGEPEGIWNLINKKKTNLCEK